MWILNQFLGHSVFVLVLIQQCKLGLQAEIIDERLVSEPNLSSLQMHSDPSSESQNWTSAVPEMQNPHGSPKTANR